MNRLAIGAALGGLAVYLYDPEMGEDRRERLLSLWRENRDGALELGRSASHAAESAEPLARRLSEAIGRGDWPAAFNRPRRKAGLAALVGGVVIGGAVAYFLDSSKGSQRRRSTLGAGRQAVRVTARTVKPVAGRLGDEVAHAVAGVVSRIRTAPTP